MPDRQPREVASLAHLPGHSYRDGTLCCEAVSLAAIAEHAGTPTYVYSGPAIDEAYRAIDRALAFAPHLIAYAVKANDNLAILARLAGLGSGADIVSGGELARCLHAGMTPNRIVFSGVGKRDDEIAEAIAHRVRAIHVESESELDAIERLATETGRVAPIALRVNPNVDPLTHPYIATGIHGTKFGLELDVARALMPRILASTALRLDGLACHIGSQIGTPAAVEEAVAIVARFAAECRKLGAPVSVLDAGGGWPISYGDQGVVRPATEHGPVDDWPHGRSLPQEQAFGAAIARGIATLPEEDRKFEVVVEPGRALVGASGVLLTRVLHVKRQSGKRFVIVDAAMTELLRPALYAAFHDIVPVRAPTAADGKTLADVVGPVCETGDFFARDRMLDEVETGDLLAIASAGAYGASMASTYNARPRAAEVLVEGSQVGVIRRRGEVSDLWRDESIEPSLVSIR